MIEVNKPKFIAKLSMPTWCDMLQEY